MRTGNSVNSARCAARKRLAPATISYPSLLGRTVMGWISPWVRRLAAFCSADRFVAERHEWRLAASGPRSERHITDQRNANATEVFASVKARNPAMGRSRD